MRRFGILIPLSFIALPSVTFAAATTFQSLANSIVQILNAGAVLLIVATIVVYFYSIVGSIFSMRNGEANGAELRTILLRGILVLFLMVSIWGIIHLLQYSLFGGPPPAASNGVIIYQ